MEVKCIDIFIVATSCHLETPIAELKICMKVDISSMHSEVGTTHDSEVNKSCFNVWNRLLYSCTSTMS